MNIISGFILGGDWRCNTSYTSACLFRTTPVSSNRYSNSVMFFFSAEIFKLQSFESEVFILLDCVTWIVQQAGEAIDKNTYINKDTV